MVELHIFLYFFIMPETYCGQDPSAPKSKGTELEAIVLHLERVLNSAVEIRDRIQRCNMRLSPGWCVEDSNTIDKPSRTWLVGSINDLLDEIDRIHKMQASELSLLSNFI